MKGLLIVNNTKEDLTMFHDAIIDYVKHNQIHDAIEGIFTLKIIHEPWKFDDSHGTMKVIVNWA